MIFHTASIGERSVPGSGRTGGASRRLRRVVTLETGYADADDVPPKGQAPFTLDLTSYGSEPAPKCRYLLVSMTGYDF